MHKKTKIIGAIIIIVLLAGGIFAYRVFKKSPTAQPQSSILFFYGRECPHCQEVEKFLSDNNISAKIKYDSIEVWHNQDNANILIGKAKECGISEDKVGVPFVFSAGKCHQGTPDVESFFKQEAGL